ncbi:hypothetical protein MKS88_005246 [Plasmodium brasilianum]|uniref:Uncharacterized protein n=1 Tax=Plasmodium brasilianum TaxID=5824 RepID=A0ACB9Y2F8_PLABR|nr:hypothetical protein MKS88_005246 [Plasmodium brasilianum]
MKKKSMHYECNIFDDRYVEFLKLKDIMKKMILEFKDNFATIHMSNMFSVVDRYKVEKKITCRKKVELKDAIKTTEEIFKELSNEKRKIIKIMSEIIEKSKNSIDKILSILNIYTLVKASQKRE